MIDRNHELSVTRQAELLELSRASVYYLPRPMSQADLALMCTALGASVHGRADAARLVAPRGLRGWTQARGNAHGTYGDRAVVSASPHDAQASRACAVSISLAWAGDRARERGLGHGHHLHPDGRGFVYLAAVVDWASRRVLAHRVSISMDTDFCVQALEEALARYGCPEIFNTDQGSQFTSAAFTDVLHKRSIRISMEGRVVGVTDGDTITLLDDDKRQHKTRFSAIDAPEKG